MSQWVMSNLKKPLPPLPRVMPGRPKKKRQRSASEGGSSSKGKAKVVVDPNGVERVTKVGCNMTCQNCYQTGHNKRSCTSEKVEKPKKLPKKKGRPRKTSGNDGASGSGVDNAGGSGGDNASGSGGLAAATDGGLVAVSGGRKVVGAKSGVKGPSKLPIGQGVFTDPATGTMYVGTTSGVPIPLIPPTVQTVVDKPTLNKRKPSERIIKKKLGIHVAGPGSSIDDIMEIE